MSGKDQSDKMFALKSNPGNFVHRVRNQRKNASGGNRVVISSTFR